MDRVTATKELINLDGYVNVPVKFRLHQKVYHPRITESGRLIDIREYYIVRINIVIDGRFTSVDYHASPYKENVRGKIFYDGQQLFHSYEEASKYAENNTRKEI